MRPNIAVSVPRLYEKVFNAVMEAQGFKKKLVQWAREVGEAWADQKLAGREPSGSLKLMYAIADALVFRRIRSAMGGRNSVLRKRRGPPLSGDQPVLLLGRDPDLRGYGLTETSPVTNLNTPEHLRIGRSGGRSPAPKSESETVGKF